MNIIREETEKMYQEYLRSNMRELLKDLIVIAMEEGKKTTSSIQRIIDKYNFTDKEVEEIYKEIDRPC